MSDLKKYLTIVFLIIFTASFAGCVKDGQSDKKTLINKEETEKIGWITDIHAANIEEMDGGESGIIYSEKFKEYFQAFLEKMQKEQIETAIVTGDAVHDGDVKYVEELKNIAQKYSVKIIWVKGNHDRINTKTMESLGVPSPYYYAYDTKNIRIIALNLTDENETIDEKQLAWLKEKLSETNLPVVVAAHIPIINYDKGSVFSQFEELEKVLKESKKVKFVISGSLHIDKETWINGIFYKTAYPLTLKNHLGSYYIINLKENKIDHFENY